MNTDAITKRMAWIACCALTATVCAMPTKQQLAQAQQLVNDLTADDLRALKAKEKTPGDVAAAHLALADEADTEAGKYLLLQGAFRLYARSGDYDAAASTLARMRGEIADLPPEVVVELVNSEMRRVAASKAPKVLAIFRDAQRMIKYRKQLAAAELDATAHPESSVFVRRLAECHACLGDWPKALPIFAKLGDIAAKWELGTAKNCDAAKAADSWWNYKAADPEPFKAHAALLYKKGLEDGSITGLRKTLAEKRVKEMDAALSVADGVAAVSGSGDRQPKTKMLDLGGGVKMEMIYVAPGSFKMGVDNGIKNQRPAHRVTLSKGFWLGKYEVTQKQWKQVMGNNPSKSFKGDDLPVNNVSLEACQEFIEKLNGKLGGEMVRLPTEAEWEYACRAGTDGDFGGTGRLDDMGWYTDNSGGKMHPVGQKQANAWGFHDMHGNVWEWCSDWWGDYPHFDVSDPVGPPSGTERTFRGGIWGAPMKWCPSPYRWKTMPNLADEHSGFRLCMTAEGDASASSRTAAEAGKAASASAVAPPDVHKAQSATPSTAAVKPAAPVRGANGKEISVQLKTGVMMDFVPCPAGTFEMGCSNSDKSPNFRHKVTITRPFWIGKYQVTRKAWAVFDPQEKKLQNRTLNVCGGLDAAKSQGVTYNKILTFCEWMNRRYKSMLPNGYVYRLPTEAEWEYALNANVDNPDDLYMKFKKGDRSVRAQISVVKSDFREKLPDVPEWALPAMTVGTKMPNAWGIYDMLGNGCEFVLDTVFVSAARNKEDGGENQTLDEIVVYEKEETDPLRTVGAAKPKAGELVYALLRGSTEWRLVHDAKWFWKSRRKVDKGDMKAHTFRLVIGPDLLKERGIKLPKLDK